MSNFKTRKEFFDAWNASFDAGTEKPWQVRAELLQQLPGILPLMAELTSVAVALENGRYEIHLTDDNEYDQTPGKSNHALCLIGAV